MASGSRTGFSVRAGWTFWLLVFVLKEEDAFRRIERRYRAGRRRPWPRRWGCRRRTPNPDATGGNKLEVQLGRGFVEEAVPEEVKEAKEAREREGGGVEVY